MPHLVLLGDSVFDNGAYVPEGPPVIEQVRHYLPADGQATLLAVDGDMTEHVAQQLRHLPTGATHLAVSVGGNDALQSAYRLFQPDQSPETLFQQLAAIKTEFSRQYRHMRDTVLALNRPTIFCTVYDQCPVDDPLLRVLAYTALTLFNDYITRSTAEVGVPLLDLRILCHQPTDFSTVSPIEPSVQGGDKIAKMLARIIAEHDFLLKQTVIYGRPESSGT